MSSGVSWQAVGAPDVEVAPQARQSWRLLTERLARETDPRIRANLGIVARHVLCEVAGDIPELMATLVPDPHYVFVTDTERGHASGAPAVQVLYERAVELGRNRREFELSLVVADQDHVVTAGALRHVMAGRDIIGFGIVYDEAPLADSWYLTEAEVLIVWPISGGGLIEGEHVYGMTERIVGEVAADSHPHLGPLERFVEPPR